MFLRFVKYFVKGDFIPRPKDEVSNPGKMITLREKGLASPPLTVV